MISVPERNQFASYAYRESFPGMKVDDEKKKVKILKASIAFIASNGIEDFNIGAIARTIGISRSNLQYHFKTNEILLESAVRFITATAQQITIRTISSNPPNVAPEQILRQTVSAAFSWAREYPDQMKCMFMFFFYACTDPQFKSVSNQIRDLGLERISTILSLITKQPHETAMNRKAAIQVQSVITGFLVSSFVHTNAGKSSEYEVLAISLLDDLVSRLPRPQ